ncbi:MAG: D-tyrosyl-tRNA(Tyr) deacylase [Erysipelotrichaceae bacterium]|jgi:D-tyrosyl-tRNA(Tyr) deacylase|nr:D-tyrosyl-tRNA(Tyr) deacylase [Erysipelotrichaceae bacterium]
MRVLLQRVSEASVTIDHQKTAEIGKGLLLLVGITHTDTKAIVEAVAQKVAGLRIFEDAQGKMNLDLKDVQGSILSVSQFTLYADYRKGRRPGFEPAAKPPLASDLYDYFNQILKNEYEVQTGVFGADMKVQLINDGPVTILIDSEELSHG